MSRSRPWPGNRIASALDRGQAASQEADLMADGLQEDI